MQSEKAVRSHLENLRTIQAACRLPHCPTCDERHVLIHLLEWVVGDAADYEHLIELAAKSAHS